MSWIYPFHLRNDVSKVVVAKCRPVKVVAAQIIVYEYINMQCQNSITTLEEIVSHILFDQLVIEEK